MNNKELAQQSNMAFDFVHKLYLETSYLIKEFEGLLSEEEEQFIIGRPSGYGVSSRSSTGLEPHLINFWMMRSLSVFFVEEAYADLSRGQTISKLNSDLRIIFLWVVFDSPDIDQPKIHIGVLHDIKGLKEKYTKFEWVIGHIAYNEQRMFANLPKVDFEDNYVGFKGYLKTINLFDINSSEDIQEKLLRPALEMYRKG